VDEVVEVLTFVRRCGPVEALPDAGRFDKPGGGGSRVSGGETEACEAAVLGGIHVATGMPVHVLAVLGTVAKYLLLYFPLTFVIEEVAFRGALDAHVHHAGEGRGWHSAMFVSALWGLWHLPISGGLPLPALVLELLAVHCLIGVPLSFAWRRTRNLAGPAFAHSAIDAVRNALMLGL
jgi:membrane protease YdiL (CAAX protease family)